MLWGNAAELQYGDEFLPWGIQEVLHAMRPILRQQDGPSNQELGVATQRGRDDVREDRRMSDHRRPDYVPQPARSLDDYGRCCGRKPIDYKSVWSTSSGKHRFCGRCCRAYDRETGLQIPNWAWRRSEDGTMFVRIGA